MRDPLTHLPDREDFRREIDALMTAHATTSADRQVVVALLGVNDFGDVNNALGYGTGDAVLVQLAQRLGTLTASGWCVARCFGDCFAVSPPIPVTRPCWSSMRSSDSALWLPIRLWSPAVFGCS